MRLATSTLAGKICWHCGTLLASGTIRYINGGMHYCAKCPEENKLSDNIWKDFAGINGMSQDEFFDELVTATMAMMSMKLDKSDKNTLIITKGEFRLQFTEIK